MSGVYERLGVILGRLYRGEIVRIGALAKELGVSTKTIQRDFKERLDFKEILREGNTFFIKKEALNTETKERIFFELFKAFCKQIGDEFERDAQRIQEKILLLPQTRHFCKIKTEVLLQVQKAITNKLLVRLMYKEHLYQDVAFEGVYIFDNRLVVGGIYEGVRQWFVLEGISKVTLGKQRHYLNVDFTPEKGGFGVSLFVYPKRAAQFKQSILAYEKKILEDDEGGLIVEFETQDLTPLVGEILSWIPDVVVLEPQELKEEIQRHLQSYIGRCQ